MSVDLDRSLRAVVVGAGGMGRGWLRAVQESSEVELAGVADLDTDRARQSVEAAGADPASVRIDTSVEPLLDELAPDFVVDVAIPEAHHPVTMAALSRGVPVLGEKPLAATLPEAVELVAAADAYDRLFMVSQNRRYHAELFDYRDRIGQLGRLGIVVSTFFKAPRFGGFREEMASPLVVDMAIHTFDAARFLTGADPVAVSCEEYNPPWSWYGGDAAATATFTFDNGTRYVYTGSWCSPGMETSWNSSWRASGELGTACWDGDGEPSIDLAEVGGEAVTDTGGGERSELTGAGIHGSLHDFVRALRTGSKPMGECHDNLVSLAMVHAATESARTGRRVRIADMLAAAREEAAERASGPVREALLRG